MKFQYLREPANPSGAHPTRHSTLRPRIPVRLQYGNRYIDLFALIDSGADECLFPVEVARALRIDLNEERSHQYAGIGAGAAYDRPAFHLYGADHSVLRRGVSQADAAGAVGHLLYDISDL